MRHARWGDFDKFFGPFTWSYSAEYPHWAVVLTSKGEGDGHNDDLCTLRISAGKATLMVVLPPIVWPWREKVYPGSWDAATIQRLGRDWYWNIDPRRYGFSLSGSHLSIYYGRTGGRSGDSTIDQSWGWFLPWKEWRHVRHSLYDLSGNHFCTLPNFHVDSYEQIKKLEADCPSAKFAFSDHDGEHLTATTRIEEREWRRGEGYFKWLSWFSTPKIERVLSIEFSSETGTEKGSWKGGTIGTSIKMLPGELHEAAFRRYCDKEHRAKYGNYKVTFLEPVEGK